MLGGGGGEGLEEFGLRALGYGLMDFLVLGTPMFRAWGLGVF